MGRAGLSWGEVVTGTEGWLAGLSLSYEGSHPGRATGVRVQVQAPGQAAVYQVSQTWDDAGRLESVTDELGGSAMAYHRHPQTGVLSRVDFQPTTGVPVFQRFERTATGYLSAQYYTRGSAVWSSSSRVMGWRYALKSDGSRESVSAYAPEGQAPAAGSPPGWAWDYNTRGEVTGAARVRAGGGVPGHQSWGYAYDLLGNRLATTRGGEPVLAASYTPNALNQYSAQGTARGLEVTGLAPEAEAVSIAVDGGTAQEVDRATAAGQAAEAGSFRTVIPLEAGQTEGRWLRVAVNTTPESGTGGTAQSREGWLFAPPATFSPVHDQDGNLVEDARWVYTWDAENRLVGMQEKVIPVAAGLDPTTGPKRLRLEFGYDAQHRRIAKVVKEWEGDAVTGGFTTVVKDRRYVYDGWNMIAELDHTTATGNGLEGSTVVRTQVWGVDLSGTMQGAGGVGGLLAVRHGGQTYVPLLDGNGNVMGLQGLGGAKDGQTVARYDYDAFGNRITNTAPELGEEVNPFGFSTKFTDEETGLVYYGFRYYSPDLGRWLSRDPIEEGDGPNLYAMVRNNPINIVDKDGRSGWQINGPWDHDYFDPKIKVEDPFLEGFVSWFVGNGRGAVTWLALSGALGQEKQNDYEFRTWVIKEVANAVQKELRTNPDARDFCSAEIKIYAKGHWQQITGRIAAGVTVSITLTRVGGKKGTAAATVLTANALIGDVYHQAGRVTGELNNRGINQQEAKKEFETQMKDGQAALKAYIDFLKAAATGK